ncbi:hypothetical protein SAMN04488541_1010108 [Thermoflexibacter ruber]|uniref:Uncharacterized protein n=1 Tax=Thermoflexibacter ruber TaxID=1003 RepID=A0A1I2EMM4_9BACT|nr:hypothetical protein SAMN04488541_1010108 [Thermoflexibacter ruber]
MYFCFQFMKNKGKNSFEMQINFVEIYKNLFIILNET